jgi:hypothetical protein
MVVRQADIPNLATSIRCFAYTHTGNIFLSLTIQHGGILEQGVAF